MARECRSSRCHGGSLLAFASLSRTALRLRACKEFGEGDRNGRGREIKKARPRFVVLGTIGPRSHWDRQIGGVLTQWSREVEFGE